jgi:SsrA-binding protein
MKSARKNLCENRKAFHDYFILERFEAGLVLVGTEVKSIRMGKANLKESFVAVKNNEAFVRGLHISPYEKGNLFNRDPLRVRKLLLHKREIVRLGKQAQQDGLTLIPLNLYLKDGYVKLEFALAKGKKLHDKRDSIAERDSKREMDRAVKMRGM